MTKNPEGIILYRGETPSAIRFDIHGGYGETWTTDRDHALSYARGPNGRLKQARLPTDAKRLILVDSENDCDYCWETLDVLAHLIDDLYLVNTLKAGLLLYDIWHESWTKIIKEAGYDTITTHNIEGPEEYVLNPTKLTLLKIVPNSVDDPLASSLELNEASHKQSTSIS
jgi:hypothetical protein